MTKERYMALADLQTLWTNQIKPSLPTKAEVNDKAAANHTHSDKADKVGSGHENEIALLTTTGNIKYSGKTISDLTVTYATDSTCQDIVDELV